MTVLFPFDATTKALAKQEEEQSSHRVDVYMCGGLLGPLL